MDQQNQNSNPDYGFILNKPDPNPRANKPTFSRKLIMLVAVSAVVLILFAVLAATFGKSTPSSKSDAAQKVVATYLTDLSAKKYDQALSLYSDNLKKQTDQKLFTTLVAPTIMARLSLSSCTLTRSGTSNGLTVISATCPIPGKMSAKQVFYLTNTNPPQIEKIVWSKQ